jgi:miniconductance mechanosensitive channel
MHFRLLHDYLEEKQLEVELANKNLGELASEPANLRRLTNIGTFRAYGLAYLQQHPEIRQDMSMMVRMMEPGSQGIPVEVYCFTAVTAWTQYERIQGDVFDHLLSILPEMGLRLYQAPSGADMIGLTGNNRIGGVLAAASLTSDLTSGVTSGLPPSVSSSESGRLRGELPTV